MQNNIFWILIAFYFNDDFVCKNLVTKLGDMADTLYSSTGKSVC